MTTITPTHTADRTDHSAAMQELIEAGHGLRVERRRLEALADRALIRYGHQVPGLAAALALIEDRQAIELACEIMDLVAAARVT